LRDMGCGFIPFGGVVALSLYGVGFWTQKPYDIPLRGLPVTYMNAPRFAR